MIEPKVARSLSNVAPNPLFLRDEELTRGLELFESQCVPKPEVMFDYTYATLPAELAEQKQEFLRGLAARGK